MSAMRRTVVAALACGVLSAGCAPRTEHPAGTPDSTASDSAARINRSWFDEAKHAPMPDDLQRELERPLAAWVLVWREAIPGFSLDSLGVAAPATFHPPYGIRYATTDSSSRRTWDRLAVRDPGSARFLIPDWYAEIGRDPIDGAPGIGHDADSAPALVDPGRDSLWVLMTCGTPCGHDFAYWVDADRIAIGGWSEANDLTTRWRGTLDIIDLRAGTLRAGITRELTKAELARYREAASRAWRKWLLASTRPS